ncbi:MAG: addiction module protein [Planctomycetes bacterium]|nr:addiction module protein [Planctomycetota bacterium]
MTAIQHTIDAHLAELMELPPEARLEIGERLIESVPPFADPEIARAWSDEIARRLKEVEDGSVEPIPAAEVYRKVWERLDEIRREASRG